WECGAGAVIIGISRKDSPGFPSAAAATASTGAGAPRYFEWFQGFILLDTRSFERSTPMNLLNLLVHKGLVRNDDVAALQNLAKGQPQRPLHLLVLDQGYAKEED